MPAVLINCVLIVVGTFLGLALKGKLPERFLTILVQALGLCVLAIGISSAIGTQNTLCVVVCLVLGTLLGELIECDGTEKLFSAPSDKRTEDYITGRFG